MIGSSFEASIAKGEVKNERRINKKTSQSFQKPLCNLYRGV